MKVGDQLHAQTALLPENNSGTHWKKVWLGPTVGLDDLKKRSIASTGIRNPKPSHHIDCAVPTHIVSLSILS